VLSRPTRHTTQINTHSKLEVPLRQVHSRRTISRLKWDPWDLADLADPQVHLDSKVLRVREVNLVTLVPTAHLELVDYLDPRDLLDQRGTVVKMDSLAPMGHLVQRALLDHPAILVPRDRKG
jgi:hypothetical protein